MNDIQSQNASLREKLDLSARKLLQFGSGMFTLFFAVLIFTVLFAPIDVGMLVTVLIICALFMFMFASLYLIRGLRLMADLKKHGETREVSGQAGLHGISYAVQIGEDRYFCVTPSRRAPANEDAAIASWPKIENAAAGGTVTLTVLGRFIIDIK